MKKKNDDENIEIKSRDLNSSEEFDKIYNIRTPKIQNQIKPIFSNRQNSIGNSPDIIKINNDNKMKSISGGLPHSIYN